jgi:UDP-glucose 4-epimerase
MKKILVIGVNSFLSKELVQLFKNKHSVVGLYNKNKNNLDADILNIPISKINSLKDEFDVVYFISAYVPSNNEVSQHKLYTVNVQFLNKCLMQFKNSKFIFVSTVSVYGTITKPITESSAINNPSAYGISKLWAEKLVMQNNNNAVLRCSSIFGKGMKQNTFLPLIINQAIKNNSINILGNGKRKQNYIFVNDAAKMLYLIFTKKEKGVFLGVDSTEYSNIAIARIIKKYLPSVKINFVGQDFSASVKYNASNTYSKLGFAFKSAFENNLKSLL